MKFRVLTLVSVFLLCQFAHAQNYAVRSTVQLLPPYSVYLSDYATDGNQKLRVILQQGDLSRPVYQLRLVMSVSLNGRVIMRTSRFFNPAPITLDPGVPTVIAGAELAPYVDSRNIDFVGYSKDQYEKTKALPEGNYEIAFTAYDYRRQDQQVSNAGSAFYYLAKNEPPLVNLPACGSKIPMRTPQQIIFSWMPRNTSSPTSAQETEYEFSLYETRPVGRNPNDIVLTSQPVFRVRTDLTQIIYGPGEPMLLDSMVYVWRVQAIDRSGKDAFRNNGYSEVCTFKYGGTDPNFDIGIVKGLQAIGETDQRAKIWWQPSDFDAYRVYYKKSGTQWQWFFNEVTKTEFKIFDLEPDNEYEVRVQGKKNGYYSPFTEIVKFRTREKTIAQCGDPAIVANELGNPLQQALTGMTFKASDHDVTFIDVQSTGQPGWFKGTGSVFLPMLGGTYYVYFDRLYVDENREATGGKMHVASEGIAKMIEDQLGAQKDKQQKANQEQWAGTDFYEDIVEFNYAIKDIDVDASGNLVITKQNGQTATNTEVPAILAKSPDKVVIVEDKNGDQFVVQKKDGQTKVTKVEGGGLSTGHANTELREMIIVSLKKYQKAIDDYQASNKEVQPGKGGGPSLFAWELDMLLAELPECLAGSKDRLGEIKSNIVSLLATQSTTFESFASDVKGRITEYQNTNQDEVDNTVCEILVEGEGSQLNKLAIHICDGLVQTGKVYYNTGKGTCKLKVTITRQDTTISQVAVKLAVAITDSKKKMEKSYTISVFDKEQNLEVDSLPSGKYEITCEIGKKSLKQSFFFREHKCDYACNVCGRDLTVTLERLSDIFPNNKNLSKQDAELLNNALKKAGFNTCKKQVHYFAQVTVETKGFDQFIEELNYRPSVFLSTFDNNCNLKIFYNQNFWSNKTYKKYFSYRVYEFDTLSKSTKYKGTGSTKYVWAPNTNTATQEQYCKGVVKAQSDTIRMPTTFSLPSKTKKEKGEYVEVNYTSTMKIEVQQRLMSLTYANRMGNGDSTSHDGYTFRGRGAIHLTGREAYREAGKKANALFKTSYDWEKNYDDLRTNKQVAVHSSIGFFLWKLNGNLEYIQNNNCTSVSKKVNGGTNGLDQRKNAYNNVLDTNLFDCSISKEN